MHSKNILAVGALFSLAAAIPVMQQEKRDIQWVTQTQEEIVTVPVTKTVWVEPGETPVTVEAHSHFGHHNNRPKVTSHVQSTVIVPPSPSSAESSPQETSVASSPSTSEVAPTPTFVAPTTQAPPPAPPTTPVAPTTVVAPTTTAVPTTTAAPPPPAAPAPSAPSSGSSSGVGGLTFGLAKAGTSYTGDLTWYDTGMGACGFTSGPSDAIVAISHIIFDSYQAEAGSDPNDNPLCNKKVTITGADGSPFTATIVDRCVGCDEGSLDLSQGFFSTVVPEGNGRVFGMHWSFD